MRLAVEEHGAGLRLFEAQQQPEQRGFSAAGRADDGDIFARRDPQTDVVEHRRAARHVTEGHAGQLDRARQFARRLAVFAKSRRRPKSAAGAGHRCGIAISASLMPEAQAPIDPIDCPNAAKKARKPPTSSNSLLFMNAAAAKMIRVAMVGNADLENAERVGGMLGGDEIPLLGRKLSRPHRQRAGGRVSDAKLADPGNQLQHEAADLALQVEVFGFVIKPDRAGGDDQQRPEHRKQRAINPSLRS